MIFASDLDNTLIFSYKKAVPNSICVEIKDKKELSFMTPYCHSELQKIINKIIFIPITTRSIEQYKRIKLIQTGNIKYALAANGGILLIDDEIDEIWYNKTLKLVSESTNELNKALKILDSDKNIYLEARIVDKLFVFGKTKNIYATATNLKNLLDLNKVYVSNVGEKIYILPKILNKGTALKRIKEKFNDTIICSGDSDFDIPMLEAADISIVPSTIYKYLKHCKQIISIDSTGMNFSDKIISNVLKFI